MEFKVGDLVYCTDSDEVTAMGVIVLLEQNRGEEFYTIYLELEEPDEYSHIDENENIIIQKLNIH